MRCCKKDMVKLSDIQTLDMTVDKMDIYVCTNCCHVTRVTRETLDDENLEELKNEFPIQLRELKID